MIQDAQHVIPRKKGYICILLQHILIDESMYSMVIDPFADVISICLWDYVSVCVCVCVYWYFPSCLHFYKHNPTLQHTKRAKLRSSCVTAASKDTLIAPLDAYLSVDVCSNWAFFPQIASNFRVKKVTSCSCHCNIGVGFIHVCRSTSVVGCTSIAKSNGPVMNATSYTCVHPAVTKCLLL